MAILPGGAMLARFLRRVGQSLGAGNGMDLNRALAAGIHGTCRVKELVVIVESEFSSVHTGSPVGLTSCANLADETEMRVYVKHILTADIARMARPVTSHFQLFQLRAQEARSLCESDRRP
jgi:hypothetical protein